MATTSTSAPLLTLSHNQRQDLEGFRAAGNWPAAYLLMRDAVREHMPITGGARWEEFRKLDSWLDRAASINSDDGSFTSEFVRGATAGASAINGRPLSNEQFQDASDKLAAMVVFDTLEGNGIPAPSVIIANDVAVAVNELKLERWQWAGALADSLPIPIGLGENYVPVAGATVRETAENYGKALNASNDGLQRVVSSLDLPYSDPMGTGDASAIMNAGTNTTSTLPTGTGFVVSVNGVDPVVNNIAKVTQNVLGANATEPVAIFDPITGELTGYKVTSFDGDGATGGLRTTVIFDKDGNLQSGESQVLVNGKVASQPLDADIAARLDTAITPSTNIEIKDTAPTTAPATTSPSVTSISEQDPEIPTFAALTPTAQLPAGEVITLAASGNGVVTDGGTSNSFGSGSNASNGSPASPSLSQSTDLALLSSDSYNQGAYGQGNVPPGWVRLEVEQPPGAADSGFHATAYKNELTGQVVIAYAGTNDMKDVTGSDFDVLLHKVPDQRDQAFDFAERAAVVAGLGTDVSSITFTGHSLGGGLAQLVAFEYDAPAMTYNAPGMTFALRLEDQANSANQTNITNVNLQLDVVSATLSPTSGGIGNTVTLPASTGQGLLMVGAILLTAANPAAGLAAIAALGLSQHGIGVVLEQLGQTHNTENISGWERDTSGNWLQRNEDGKSPPSYANPEMQARLDQTRDSLVDLNAMAASSQDRIGQTLAYNSVVGKIQNDFFAEKLTLQNTPDGHYCPEMEFEISRNSLI